ncbi:MAG: hypothetical protein ACHQIO_21885, partial [Nevskiales bacterium]
VGIIQKGRVEIGWDVPEVGSLAVAAAGQLAVKVAGPDAFKNTVGQTFTRFTYCAGTGQADPVLTDFIRRVQAFAPGRGMQLDYFNIANGYDGAYILRAAIEATGATDGPTLAKWMESHAGEIKIVSVAKLTASNTNHFMFGTDSLTMAQHPESRNEQGLQQRVGC